MITFPRIKNNYVSQYITDTFGGYNHNLKIGEGEFYEMENLTSSFYPMLASRNKRGTVAELTAPGGLLAKSALAYIDNRRLIYDGNDITDNLTEAGYSISEGEKNLVSMGAYILIFPDKLYINTEDLTDCGSINAQFESTGEVSYSLCRIDGSAYAKHVVSASAPANPENNALWIDSSSSPHVLKQYSAQTALWTDIATVYTKISHAGIGKNLKVYDGVSIYGCEAEGSCADQIEALNGTKIVYDRGDDYIVVVGILDEACSQSSGKVSISRTMPELDFVTEAENRLWGCKYGVVNGRTVNEIYACALGDFKNWNQFLGLATDSYTASVGTDGPWTGAVTLLGAPIFFKENVLHKVYISSTGAHSIADTACRGVQKGSHKSLQVVNEKLFYKSVSGVCVYDGSLPDSISDALGAERYSDAVAGSLEDKYYISMKDKKGAWHLFVYDSGKGFWHREDSTQAMCFARCSGELFFIDSASKKLLSINGTVGTEEEKLKWKAESGLQGYRSPGKKYVSRVNLRVVLPIGSEISVYIQYDSYDYWHSIGYVLGSGVDSFVIPVIPRRCDHFKIRLQGSGEFRLYSITKNYETGSDM